VIDSVGSSLPDYLKVSGGDELQTEE